MDIYENLPATLLCSDWIVRPDEIDSRPFVPIHRQLQYRSAQNVHTNPPRPKAGSTKSRARHHGLYRQGFVDRRKDHDKAVKDSISASLLIENYRNRRK